MFATPEDIATRAGRELTAVEGGTVTFLLQTATELILQALGTLDSPPTWVSLYADEPPPDPPGAVRGVCTEVVYRAFTNPEAAAAMAAGDLSVSYRAKVADSLFLTSQERGTVRKAAGLGSFQSVTLESPYSGGTGLDPELVEIMEGQP